MKDMKSEKENDYGQCLRTPTLKQVKRISTKERIISDRNAEENEMYIEISTNGNLIE
jgi:hypothetical protein